MKNLLRICAVCVAAFLLTSCCKPYYQMVSVKPMDNSLLKSGENGLYYEDDSIKIEYDLFYGDNKVAYSIFNKSDKVLWINKKASATISNMAVGGYWIGEENNDELYDYFYTVPPHTYKIVTTCNYIEARFEDMKLKDKPKSKRAETVSFNQENTIGVLGDFISYKFGEDGENQGVGLYFYVNKVTNYNRKDFLCKDGTKYFLNPHKYPSCIKAQTSNKTVKVSKKYKPVFAPNNALYIKYFTNPNCK